ncbi:hypothetical protein ACVWW7_008056 [Bradyrhizobium sp. LM6.9]
MPIQFTTDDSPGHRRLALWQDIVCDVFVGLDCKSDLGSAFRGSVTRAPLGKAECSEVCSDRQHVLRTPSRIARSDQDFILIALGNRGAGGVVQDGREAVVHPGEFALYDTTRPYELKFDGTFTQTIFKVPREMLQRRLGATEALTASTFGPDSPLQRIAYDFIYRLCQSADQIDPLHAAALSEQAVDVLAMALGERLGPDAAAVLDPSLRPALPAESAYPGLSCRSRPLAVRDRSGARHLLPLRQRSPRRRGHLVPALPPR